VNLKKGLCKTDESEIRPGGQETNEAPDDSPALKGLLNYGYRMKRGTRSSCR
jgi:hypothetical protein